MVCVDQLDPSRLVSGELAFRNILRTEAAVSRNLKQPNREGLDIYTASAMSAEGALETRVFQQWVASIQKDRAIVLKQGRQLRDENALEIKRKGKGGGKTDGADGAGGGSVF